jgi:bacteriocin biosynthesis cyclodehydratase domain-containing protein
VQLVPFNGGAVVKRGSRLITVQGEGAADILRRLLTIPEDRGASRSEIYNLFAPSEQETVASLLDKLIEAHIFVSADDRRYPTGDTPESNLDLFYWHCGVSSKAIAERINARRFVILGVNYVSQYMVESLRAAGMANFHVVDFPPLRNLRLFDESGRLRGEDWRCAPTVTPLDFEEWSNEASPQSFDCIIATSDFSATQTFRHWNNVCLLAKCCFFPVCMADTTGFAGPLVVPGETACFECYWMRRNSHLRHPESRRAVEEVAFEGQLVSGVHPAMAAMVGNLAAFELTKFYSESSLPSNVGMLIEIDLLSPAMAKRKILKVPRCTVCSPLLAHSSMTPRKSFLGPLTERAT